MDRPTSRKRQHLFSTLIGLGLVGCSALLTACQPVDPEGSRSERASQGHANNPTGLEQKARQSGWSEGHSATVACLHGERAQTDGNELRCEDQAFVRQNYAAAPTGP